MQKRRAIVVLISDFMDTGYTKELRATSRHHNVICCRVSDPLEAELPNVGLVELEDPETGELMLVDTGSKALRAEFARRSAEEDASLKQLMRKLSIDALFVSTARPFIQDVHKLFRQRQLRAIRG